MSKVLIAHEGNIYEAVPYTQDDVQARIEIFNRRDTSQPEYDDRERERIRQTKAYVNAGLSYLKLHAFGDL
jgi:hypothetical protein